MVRVAQMCGATLLLAACAIDTATVATLRAQQREHLTARSHQVESVRTSLDAARNTLTASPGNAPELNSALRALEERVDALAGTLAARNTALAAIQGTLTRREFEALRVDGAALDARAARELALLGTEVSSVEGRLFDLQRVQGEAVRAALTSTSSVEN